MNKIAILGPESTGKTELAKNLATFYKSPWVPEYAREYVENLTQPYTYEDICIIAEKQIEFEVRYGEKEIEYDFVFFDTDLIITKVWFEYCYGKVPCFVTKHLEKGFFDLYLLCEPDLPWEADPVREHGDDRGFFYDLYKSEIDKYRKPFVTVNGFGKQRIENAIKAINQKFGNKSFIL